MRSHMTSDLTGASCAIQIDVLYTLLCSNDDNRDEKITMNGWFYAIQKIGSH